MKRVVTASDIPPAGDLRIPLGSIVTPSARETAATRGVRIVEVPADQIVAVRRARKTIAIGADHGGFRLKEALKPVLESLGLEIRDVGVYEEKPADYPDIAARGGRTGGLRRATRGIVIDGAGIGSSMAANKVPGIRAALCYDKASARNSREHNDSNVLTLGARLLTQTQAEDVLRTWIATPFAGGRHQARVQKIIDIERRYLKKGILVTQAELDSLVAQIGEEILARVGQPRSRPRQKGEGLNLPDQVCPGCQQRCPQTCARNTKEIIAAGADRVSASDRLTKIDPAIAALIDHTILKAEATRADIVKVCREARQYSFASVCVNPYWVPLVRAELAGSPVKVCTVVGFPAGRDQHRSEGRRNRRRRARRRAGNRHGDQHRRAALGRSRRGARGYRAVVARLARGPAPSSR